MWWHVAPRKSHAKAALNEMELHCTTVSPPPEKHLPNRTSECSWRLWHGRKSQSVGEEGNFFVEKWEQLSWFFFSRYLSLCVQPGLPEGVLTFSQEESLQVARPSGFPGIWELFPLALGRWADGSSSPWTSLVRSRASPCRTNPRTLSLAEKTLVAGLHTHKS